MAAQYYISITRWQHNIILQSTDGSTILWVNQQMAAQYYISITRWQKQYYIPINRWQHTIIGQSTDGSTILYWQHNIIFQSPDDSTILYCNPQMAAQYYISINSWQHNLMGQSPDGSTINNNHGDLWLTLLSGNSRHVHVLRIRNAAAIRGGIYDLFDVSRSASDGDRTRRGLDGAGRGAQTAAPRPLVLYNNTQ